MSIIYSFLQKRKLHENQYGFVMVFAAYIIAALMLALGSDAIYNINSAAAGISLETEEETQKSQEIKSFSTNGSQYGTLEVDRNLVNPYGLTDMKVNNDTSTSGDSIWFLGSAMNHEVFDDLMINLDDTVITNEAVSKTVNEKANVSKKVKSTNSNITQEEIKMLERIVEAEASGEDLVGKILVANVVLNRVNNKAFPDSIEEVIFQESDGDYQFSPVSSKRYWSVKISKESKKAVEKALDGEDYSKGALFFMARKKSKSESAKWFDNNLKWLFRHGGHEFYKIK